MTVILVLATFVAFLLIDHFFSRKHVVVAAEPSVMKRPPMPLDPSLVNGFKVPENLRYHPGHAWALSESPSLVRIGLDDFSSKLIGEVEGVTLPQRGQWVRQGQKIWSFLRNGVKVDMVSPIEGSVADINQAVASDPKLALRDPYGEGWMVTVQSPDAKTNFRNLIGGAMSRWWMEEAAGRLRKRIPALATATAMAQDGGVAVNNLTSGLNDEQFAELAKEFLMS